MNVEISRCPQCGQAVYRITTEVDQLACPGCQRTANAADLHWERALCVDGRDGLSTSDSTSTCTTAGPAAVPATDLLGPPFQPLGGTDWQRELHAVSDALAASGPPPARAARRGHLSGLWEASKVVLGGLVGLVVAQLILWWLPGNLRRDPFGLADQLPARLKFLLPEEHLDPPR